MNKHYQWLNRQLPQWVDKAIISDAQAAALRQMYPLQDAVGLGRLLLTGIGAVMIGLGVILLFAYNWDDMGKFSKLAVIFSGLIGAHLSALFTRSHHRVYSESLFALGTMLMGAGIFLVGQIYHMDSHYPNALLMWSIGALLLAWALPSLTQAFMAIILIISWHLFEVIDFYFANHQGFLLLLLGFFPLLWRLRSPVLARFAAVGWFLALGFSSSVVDEDLVVTNLLLSSLALIGLERVGALFASETGHELGAEMAKPALLLVVGIMYLMSFSDLAPELVLTQPDGAVPISYFVISLLLSQVIFFGLLYRRQLNAVMIVAESAVVLALLPLLFALLFAPPTARDITTLVSFGFNLLLLGMSVWLMIDGARHADRRHMLRGSILFALLAMARYIDLFDSLIARAVVFLLVGIALFAVSHVYQRNKKQVGV